MRLFIFSILVIFSMNIYGQHLHNENHKDQHEGHNQHKSHEIHTENANEHMHQKNFFDLVERFEESERNEWQKVSDVLRFLGPWDNKSVADIGAGTGYFAFPLAELGATVQAVDIDERFLAYIEGRKKETTMLIRDNITSVLATESNANIQGQVDRIIMVNTYHHIENRSDYFNRLLASLNEDSKLIIVDFKMGDLPIGPPDWHKVSETVMTQELNDAGFQLDSIESNLLPYQHILIFSAK